MGPDVKISYDEFIDVIGEFAALMERFSERTCGPTREDHDVAFCVNCEGGFCVRCGRADKWFLACIHRPAWRHDI